MKKDKPTLAAWLLLAGMIAQPAGVSGMAEGRWLLGGIVAVAGLAAWLIVPYIDRDATY